MFKKWFGLALLVVFFFVVQIKPSLAENDADTYSVDLGIQRAMLKIADHLEYFTQNDSWSSQVHGPVFLFTRVVTMKKLLGGLAEKLGSQTKKYTEKQKRTGDFAAGSDIRVELRRVIELIEIIAGKNSSFNHETMGKSVKALVHEIRSHFKTRKISTLNRGLLVSLFENLKVLDAAASKKAYSDVLTAFSGSIDGVKVAQPHEEHLPLMAALHFIKDTGQRLPGGESSTVFIDFWPGVESVLNDFLRSINKQSLLLDAQFVLSNFGTIYREDVRYLNDVLSHETLDLQQMRNEVELKEMRKRGHVLRRLQNLQRFNARCEYDLAHRKATSNNPDTSPRTF